MGYEAILPEGTFYVMVRSPIDDDARYADLLADDELFVMPGWVVELPGWFRLSLTANDAMIERGLPIFERVRAAALGDER
jgi:aspartate aminotransferase